MPNPGIPAGFSGSTSITRATTASAADARVDTVPDQPQAQNPPLTPDNQSATSNTTNDLATIWLAPPRPEDIPILEEVIGDSPRLPGGSTPEPNGGDLAGAVPARLDNAGYPPAAAGAAAPTTPAAFPYAGPAAMDRRASLPPTTPATVGGSAPIVDPLMSALVSAPPAATETPAPAPFPYPGPAASATATPGVSGLPAWSPDNPALLSPAGSPDTVSPIVPAAASSDEPVQTTLPGMLPSADTVAAVPAFPPATLGSEAPATTSPPSALPMNMDFPAPAGMPIPSGNAPAAASAPALSPALPSVGNLNNDFPVAGSAWPTATATTALPATTPSGVGTAGSTALDPGIPVEFGIAMPSGTVGTVVVTPPGPGVSSIGSEPRAASIVPPAPLPPAPVVETPVGNRAGVSASDFGGTTKSSSSPSSSPTPRGRWSVGESGSSPSSTVTFTPSASDAESKRRNTVSTPPPALPSSSNFVEPSPAPSRSGSGRRPREESLGEMPPLLGEGL